MKIGTIARPHLIVICTLLVILVVWCFVFPQTLEAQSNFKLDSASVIHLKGTSTLHDWSMTAHEISGDATVNLSADRQLSSITGFSLKLPVHNLKGESSGMEKSTYKALKADKYEFILFDLISARFIKSGSDNYRILLHGNMTIAGVTQATTLNASAAMNTDGTISCTGSLPIYMSDYNIERPTYLLGTMKVGDVLTLTYNLIFVQ